MEEKKKNEETEYAYRPENNDIYEGSEAYIFISYSHKNVQQLSYVKELLRRYRVRFWYDRGLYSGIDFNREIAGHLSRATCCLFLMSSDAVESEYIKDELNFAKNRRIPLHTLKLHEFEIPEDIYLMIGRFNIIEMNGDYERDLLKSLPPEVFAPPELPESPAEEEMAVAAEEGTGEYEHPLYERGAEVARRQGTIFYKGRHRELDYPVIILEEQLQEFHLEEAKQLSWIAAEVSHPMFPKIYDVRFEKNKMWTYQECRGEVFLDEYLSQLPSESEVIQWALKFVDMLEYLHCKWLGFFELHVSNLTVLADGSLGIWRLNNPYYGLSANMFDIRYDDFETSGSAVHVAELLYLLSTGKEPTRPVEEVADERRSKRFLEKVNRIINRCEYRFGYDFYGTFQELREDLKKKRVTLGDTLNVKLQKWLFAQPDEDAERSEYDAETDARHLWPWRDASDEDAVEPMYEPRYQPVCRPDETERQPDREYRNSLWIGGRYFGKDPLAHWRMNKDDKTNE